MTSKQVEISSAADLGEVLRAVRKESGLTQHGTLSLIRVFAVMAA